MRSNRARFAEGTLGGLAVQRFPLISELQLVSTTTFVSWMILYHRKTAIGM
jgi:hypothetical protein